MPSNTPHITSNQGPTNSNIGTKDPEQSSDNTTFLKAQEKQHFNKPPQVLVIGAGSRGTSYARAALKCSNAIIAAVCEPIEYKRVLFGRKFIWGDGGVPPYGTAFRDWKEWVEYEKARRESEKTGKGLTGIGGFAPIVIDAIFVCVLDEMHEEVVCGIAGLGVHVCVEKPLSTTLESCMNIYRALKSAGVENGCADGQSNSGGKKKETLFGICHVLRYSPHNMMLRHLVLEKEVIGDVVSIEHVEPVNWWHFSHSYVRGNWRKESTTAPSLLTKSCHDIDFLMWMLCSPPSEATDTTPHLPSYITSTGSRKFFRRERKPTAAGDATNCLSCPHEPDCIYSAKKIYLDKHLQHGDTGWPVKIVNPEIEDIFRTSGPEAAATQLLKNLSEDYTSSTSVAEVEARPWFGRCVWETDNDVCDDQCVTIAWDDDPLSHDRNGLPILKNRGAKTAQFHMIAFTEAQCQRRGRIYGAAGEIAYDSTSITVHDFSTGETVTHTPHMAGGGHGGGDEGLVRQFLRAVDAVDEGGMASADAQRRFLGCDLDEAFRSHAVVFAAEEARTQKKVVDWGKWWEERVEKGLE